MANRVTTRMSDLGDRAKDRMTEHRLDKLDRENDRLKHEVRLLRDDLQEERSALQRALDALGRDEHVTVETKAPKRRGRLLSLVAIGGGAYLLGAKAGRERYDQVVDKAKSLKSSVADRNGHGADEPWVPNEAPGTATSANDPGSTASGS